MRRIYAAPTPKRQADRRDVWQITDAKRRHRARARLTKSR